jgi:LPS-assembly lipoprotein
MFIFSRYQKYLAGIILLSILTACGFHVRGSNNAPISFQSIYLEPITSPLNIELKRYLGNDVQFVESAKDAQIILEIINETRNRNVLSVNNQGRVREYTLMYSVKFKIKNNQNIELIPPSEINLQRNVSYDDTQALAKEREETFLYRDMQSDAVQQVARRLSMLKP